MSPAQSPRVLVVDDVADVRRMFGQFLTLEGMEPSFAVDGVEGLAAARAFPPDLVLCDLHMVLPRARPERKPGLPHSAST